MTYKDLKVGDFFTTLHDDNTLYMKTDQPSQAICIEGNSMSTGHIVRMFAITEVQKIDHIEIKK